MKYLHIASAFLIIGLSTQAQPVSASELTELSELADSPASITASARRHRHHHRRAARTHYDASGNGVVRAKSGIKVRVAPSAQSALQCIVDYVEGAGVHVKAMRGYGAGTVRGSLHPGGKALDINQTARNVTRPVVPRSVSNAAADRCGVISGARWGYADNGHWNLAVHGRTSQEPWPRVVQQEVSP